MCASKFQFILMFFCRVQGLIRSGALKEADKPIWFEVYEAFPPKVEPVYERPEPKQEVQQLLYPEDIIRA
jgi:small subunit ribosomal protein S23